MYQYTLDGDSREIFTSAGISELLQRLSSDGVFSIKILNIAKQLSTIFTLLPHGSKLIWGVGGFALESIPYNTFSGTGQRCEKVGGSLARWTLESHVNEEGLRGVDVAKVNLSSFIQDGNFVKDLLNFLSNIAKTRKRQN
jgi:hypothetical protein